MLSLLKYKVISFVRGVFRSIGFSISRINYKSPLIHHKIDLIFDVGANIGQYAMSMRTEGYKGKIVSFEPLPDAYEMLIKNSHKDPFWTVHKRCAVGAKLGEADINISQNSYSSSLLPMLQVHSSAAPASVYIGKAKTDVITLDSVFDFYRKNNEKIFLKIDTQGFENEVLKGLSKNLKNIFGVQLELSVVPLYENQNLYKYFFAFFEENGFFLWSLIPGFADAKTGQLFQFDAIFVRNS
ncbi:FkbM family methyltransferase [Prosthecochloris sp. SCSIO W1101]|uniref:FkbM family methyltransferase n=1 Tax=Prosthecochloris sp. SCSIO W1101 TaxID=2992242 RepID=UPI00223E28FE|nr:FkbM family methyltransferase [Prosthecochloris sp. SCSIO W1101]UZJ42721.1 FkbM family methyltransferase [Prosthecochloris sp. SCSIO W1101]